MPRTRGQRFFFIQTFSGKASRFFFLHNGQEHRRQLFLIGPVPQAGLLLRVGEKAALQQYRPAVHMVHQIDGVRDWLAFPAVVRLQVLPQGPLQGLGQLLRALSFGVKGLAAPVFPLGIGVLMDAQQPIFS